MERKTITERMSVLMELLKAMLVGIGITAAGAAAAATMVNKEWISENAISPIAVITLIVASFAVTVLVGKTYKEKCFVMSLGGGVSYLALVIGCNALIFGGQFEGLLGGMLTIMGSCLVAALLLSRQKSQSTAYFKRVPTP
jgi:putative membrane protein (TIGR04086 family)